MPITPRTIIHHCLIGLEVKIIKSSNVKNLNIMGKVIDETKNTLIIKTKKKEAQIPKKNSIFQFRLSNNQVVEIKGALLLGRPEERIKKKVSKWTFFN